MTNAFGVCREGAGLAKGAATPEPVSSPALRTGDRLRRRGGAGLEHVQRIDAARFAVDRNKDRVSAAMNGSDNHEIVRQMETFDAEIRIALAKLPPHPLLEALRSVRVAKDRLALAEKPADLDQGACVGGS